MRHPEVAVFNRDAFIETYYPEGLDLYAGLASQAIDDFWLAASEKTADTAIETFVFDYFTGSAEERSDILLNRIRKQLALENVSLHFLMTSREKTVQQYIKRASLPYHIAQNDYDHFWRNVSDILPENADDEKNFHFDTVRFIYPTQLVLPGMPLL